MEDGLQARRTTSCQMGLDRIIINNLRVVEPIPKKLDELVEPSGAPSPPDDADDADGMEEDADAIMEDCGPEDEIIVDNGNEIVHGIGHTNGDANENANEDTTEDAPEDTNENGNEEGNVLEENENDDKGDTDDEIVDCKLKEEGSKRNGCVMC